MIIFLAYIKAVAVLLIIAAVITILAFILNLIGIKTRDLHRKYVFYKIVTYFALLVG